MKINLTDRMQSIASMVIQGESVADIGTDHGYIPAYLLSSDICPSAVLSDIAKDPLERSKRTFLKYGINADFRLGSGLDVLKEGEVSSVIIAGMGGETIIDILSKDILKSHSFKRIILQPRTFCDELRLWLVNNGFKLVNYGLVLEKNNICEIYAVENGNNTTDETQVLSEYLFEQNDPLIKDFILDKLKKRSVILKNLKESKKDQSMLIEKYQNEVEYLNKRFKELNN